MSYTDPLCTLPAPHVCVRRDGVALTGDNGDCFATAARAATRPAPRPERETLARLHRSYWARKGAERRAAGL